MLYDPAGNLQSHTDFNGASTTFSYTTKTGSRERTIRTTRTSVTRTHRPDSVKQSRIIAEFMSYQYDIRDRLTHVGNPDGSILDYGYDVSSNRTSLTIPSGTTGYTFDELNRLKTVTDSDSGVSSYSYDNAGNPRHGRLSKRHGCELYL